MSLINDALKRTQGVQQKTAPAATGPALRPADAAQAKSGSGARTLLFIMVAAVVLGNFLLWMAFKDSGTQESDVRAVTPAQVQATPAPAVALTTQPLAEPTAARPVAAPPPLAAETIAPVAAATPPVEETTFGPVTTNAPAAEPHVVFVEPPKPTVLRLQSIIYGTRPSAMIAGKFLFVGDSIQGHQVVAIDKATVTLVGQGQTNVLSLP